MARDLEAPSGGASDAGEIYLARGAEVDPHRPVMTGDVFTGVPIISPLTGEKKDLDVMVVQHPCALRSDGVLLNPGVLVAEVRRHKVIEDWAKYGKLMPLPDLLVGVESGKRNQAGFFDRLHMAASPELLVPGRRIACLTEDGVCLALQRFNHHNSRAMVPTETIAEVVGGPFTEVEVMEEWCQAAAEHGVPIDIAAADCLAWLREDLGDGRTRQLDLEVPQNRSRIRREARAVCKDRDASAWACLLPSGAA